MSMLSSLGALLLVFGLLGALLLWARRVAAGVAPAGALRVVDAVSLGSGRSVTVVRSGERYFLLGSTPHSIALIAELAPGSVAGPEQTAAPARLPTLPEVAARLRSLRNTP
jgi:flagellar biosynthetic protein FliO